MILNKIAYWTEQKGVKHSHLAKKCGVSNQTFSRWATNKTQPDLIQSYIISRELGIKMEELIKGEEE